LFAGNFSVEDRKYKNTERRRSLLVDKPFQYRLIRFLGAVWLFNTVVLAGLIYYLYAGPAFRVDQPGQPDVQLLPYSVPLFFVLVSLGALAGLALVISVGLHMSHQIAGPLAQLKARLRQVAQGDMNFEMRFRRGDYLDDLPDYFNEMVQSLKERSRSEFETLKAIEAALDETSPGRERLHEFLEEKETLLTETTPAAPLDTPDASKSSDPLAALES